ncbi:amidohydrolase family protein [Dinghuibacter silviterrae]|uniref:Cytosine/adenosine deaminase-related metal-dependent hydrolase n=1 Tax=Dinghuibacter silviterrae TaxID=1539049 RepID=A0A4R8DSZ8_9BACT|nr:amidohydrolase family protein [Dinghuibacter silviterrae]TDX00535.1 cytosine/adenosine deaminase-related metal-dependent hydrolase [Dinghuibacter silviterrae]
MIVSSTKPLALIGALWDPAIGETEKVVLIENGKIAQLLEGTAAVPPGFTPIRLPPGTVMFPGLINLHTHTTYNILPIWDSGQVWKNRFQWRNNPAYKQNIGGLLDYIQKNWQHDPDPHFVAAVAQKATNNTPAETTAAVETAAAAALAAAVAQVNLAYAVISEIQAVAGGTTLIQETANLDQEPAGERSFIIRNTGDQTDLQIAGTQQVFSVVDFYRPDVLPDGTAGQDTSAWTPVQQQSYTDFVQSVNSGNVPYYTTLVHLGEGKSGLLKNSTPDPYSQKEVTLFFQSLASDIKDNGSLSKAHLALTHGCGIDPDHQAQTMTAGAISLIWSPVSNLLLYLDTTDVRKLMAHGINICLGSDWSPSGSKHVLDEVKFAGFVSDLLGWGLNNKDLFAMATVNGAKALGVPEAGILRTGGDADLFVFKKVNPKEEALDALLAGDDSDVEFVMVNGRIVFGRTAYFQELGVDFQGFPASEGAGVAQRGVSINSSLSFDLVRSLEIIDTLFERYCTSVLQQPQMKRTRFLASDDAAYMGKMEALKKKLQSLYL